MLVLTALATVVFDLIVAVEIGVVAAAFLALRNVARTTGATLAPIEVEVDTDEERDLLREHIVAYRIDGALFFGAAQRFLADFTQVADVEVVILRLPDLQVLDATGAQALGAIIEDLEHRHITVLLKGPRPEHEKLLRTVGALDRLAQRAPSVQRPGRGHRPCPHPRRPPSGRRPARAHRFWRLIEALAPQSGARTTQSWLTWAPAAVMMSRMVIGPSLGSRGALPEPCSEMSWPAACGPQGPDRGLLLRPVRRTGRSWK